MKGQSERTGLPRRAPAIAFLLDWAQRKSFHFAISFCILAAACSTWLSGLNFPEQNNRWQIPVVLDFAHSAEGPHDAYAQSFTNFISLFWIVVRSFTTEANIERVFVTLQLAGNALLACAIFALLRHVSRSPWASAWVTGFLCFCYGLWGATQLGYSEVFTTYATHTQYAVALCLFAFLQLLGGRSLRAAILLGGAANINLFMGVWGALAAGLMLVGLDRRVASRRQILFSLLFLLIAAPVALWGLHASAGGGIVPYAFLRRSLAGHVFGFDYPRALVQTFALGLAAALAVRTAPRDHGSHVCGMAMLACMIVLGLGAIMPYLSQSHLPILLHPLRFVSVVMPMTALCAGLLFITAWEKPSAPLLFPAAMALAGFMLKLPVVSVIGFTLAIPQADRKARLLALLLATACLLALWLPAPETEISTKSVMAFGLTCLILTAISLLQPDAPPLPSRMIAAVSAAITIAPASPLTQPAILLTTMALCLWLALPDRPRLAAAAAGCAALVMLMSVRGDPVALPGIGIGLSLLILSPLIARLRGFDRLARLGLAALVPALMLLGGLSGARAGFAPDPSAQQRDFLAAQHWARRNTPPDTMFLPIHVEDGFSLLSRRPVWWEESHGAAALWQPSYYPIWSRRGTMLDAASSEPVLLDLARREQIAYLVVPSAEAHRFANIPTAFRNEHYAILKVSGSHQ